MRAILLSVRPEWVEKILNGEKTVEIRKSSPKYKLPIEVYIYCTKGGKAIKKEVTLASNNHTYIRKLNGEIVGKFTLNKVIDIHYLDENGLQEASCLTPTELYKYANNGRKQLYAWCIDNLEVFAFPKTLCSTGNPGDTFSGIHPIKKYGYDKCGDRGHCSIGQQGGGDKCNEPICLQNSPYGTKPPQSWQYVEVANADTPN